MKSVPNLPLSVLMITGLSTYVGPYQEKISRACRIRCTLVYFRGKRIKDWQSILDVLWKGWRKREGGRGAPPDFGSSVNPISTRGGHIQPTNYYLPPPQIFRPNAIPNDKLITWGQMKNKSTYTLGLLHTCVDDRRRTFLLHQYISYHKSNGDFGLFLGNSNTRVTKPHCSVVSQAKYLTIIHSST